MPMNITANPAEKPAEKPAVASRAWSQSAIAAGLPPGIAAMNWLTATSAARKQEAQNSGYDETDHHVLQRAHADGQRLEREHDAAAQLSDSDAISNICRKRLAGIRI